MPTPYQEAYNEALMQARAEFRDGLSRQLLARLHADFARMLVSIASAADEGQLTAERAEALKRSIQRHLARYARQLELSLGDGARQAATLAVSGHREALSAVAEAAGVEISFSFDEVPERALANMVARRGLDVTDRGGLSGTFETLVRRRVRHLSGPIDEMLTDAVAQGKSAGSLAKDLARTMARSEPALEAALERIQGGRSLLHRGQLDRITDNPELRRLLYDARRIATTEINQSYNAGFQEGARSSPVVSLLRWQTSGRHEGLPSYPDVCTYYEGADHEGYGAGVFHKHTCPSLPHPHCGCTQSAILRRPSEWNDPDPPIPNVPGTADEERMRAILEANATERSRSITDAFVQNQTKVANARIEAAYSVAKEYR